MENQAKSRQKMGWGGGKPDYSGYPSDAADWPFLPVSGRLTVSIWMQYTPVSAVYPSA